MKVAPLLPDLGPVGAERIDMLMQLVRQWLRKGIAVKFVRCQVKGELLAVWLVEAEVGDSVRWYEGYSTT